MHQGLEDVPALLSGGGDDGTHSGEVAGTPLGAEATGDLLAQLGHSEVTFGLIVRKRRARVGEESQAFLLVLAEAEREVMTDAAFLSSALAGPERRRRLVEGDGVVEDAGPGPRDPGHQGGGHVAAVLTGEAGSPVCALTVEALRVLRTTRKTAIKCRRAALQKLHNTIVAAPEEVRDQVRNLTRMQRLRTCAAWRPDTVGYRDPVVATKLSLMLLSVEN